MARERPLVVQADERALFKFHLVSPGDDLDEVEVRADRGTNGIEFETKKGISLSVYGREDGERKIFSSEGNGFVTLELRSSDLLDKIEFIPAYDLNHYDFSSISL